MDCGETWTDTTTLPYTGLADRIFANRHGQRARRTGFHHMVPLTSESRHQAGFCIFANKSIYELDERNRLHWRASLNGSRPLCICSTAEMVFYGEYRSNQERSPISVWAASVNDLSKWSPIYTFNNIRHIHGVFVDPLDNSIWVTTGDFDSESALWRTDNNFETLEKIVGGSQQCRAVQLLFDRDHIHFASDAPDEVNHIYKLHRSSLNIEKSTTVAGPVFFGTTVGNSHFFSTVVEPSEINKTKYVELWRYDFELNTTTNAITKDSTTWYRFLKLKKDLLPMKIFQYGQIRFPYGPGDQNHLFFTPRSTTFDDNSFRIDVKGTTGAPIDATNLSKYLIV